MSLPFLAKPEKNGIIIKTTAKISNLQQTPKYLWKWMAKSMRYKFVTKFNLLSTKRKRNRWVNRVGVSSGIVHFLHIQQWLHLKHLTHRANYRTAHHSTQIQPWLHPLHHPPPLPLCANSGAFQKFKCWGGDGGNFRFSMGSISHLPFTL